MRRQGIDKDSITAAFDRKREMRLFHGKAPSIL